MKITLLKSSQRGASFKLLKSDFGDQQKIKTGYGVLAPTYSNKDILITGIGQDNRLGPTVWVSYIII